MLRHVIQVRRRQHHPRARHRMRHAMPRLAPARMPGPALALTLTPAASPSEPDPGADRPPVHRIAAPLARAYRAHRTPRTQVTLRSTREAVAGTGRHRRPWPTPNRNPAHTANPAALIATSENPVIDLAGFWFSRRLPNPANPAAMRGVRVLALASAGLVTGPLAAPRRRSAAIVRGLQGLRGHFRALPGVFVGYELLDPPRVVLGVAVDCSL